jgi:hypothetical protein
MGKKNLMTNSYIIVEAVKDKGGSENFIISIYSNKNEAYWLLGG